MLGCLCAPAQTMDNSGGGSPKTIEVFFDALRRMEINEAHRALQESQQTKDNTLALALLQSYQGRTQTFDADTTELGVDGKILWHLVNGYSNEGEDNENTVAAFQNFSRAIQLSDSYNRVNALKFSLTSMLELLRKQFFFGDEYFLPYLNHYREIATDTDDARILLLYEIGLNSNEKDDMSSEFQGLDMMRKLDSLFIDVSDERALKTKYYFEKAIQLKLEAKYEQAMYELRHALRNANGQPENVAIQEAATWHISTLHLLGGRKDSALFYWNRSSALSKKLRNKFYNERLASWIYKDMGQMDSAYHYLNESVFTEALVDGKQQRFQSALLSVENQTEKLKLDKLRLDNRRKTNQNYLIGAISLLLIGTLTAFFLHQNTTKKRKLAEQEALLEQQKVETLLKEQELVSIDAMIEGQEKERTKVANELHDDLGSLMATVKLHFDNVKVDKKDPALKNAQDLLEKAYQKIRGMAHAKNSGVMANQGLLPAVQKMSRTISETKALEVTVEDFGMADRLENSLELTIFRIIQELTTNIIKHAKATKANIQFTQHEDNLNIIVEDNGKGFDISAIKRASLGMGLGTIEKRIEHLGGTFTVDSVLGKGTSILIDIPV